MVFIGNIGIIIVMYDVIIIGSGPAGLTAGIYAARASLKTLIIGGTRWGGQLMLTTEIENFPGFPEGIQGPELMTRIRKQAEKFGAEIIEEDFIKGDFAPLRQGSEGQAKHDFFTLSTQNKTYKAKSVIIATGADTRWLGIPGEKELIGRGVSTCAPCDAPFFKEKNVIVVGGGDSAMEEAIVLTKFAKKVFVVHRRDELRASAIMQKRIKENPKIGLILDTELAEVIGQNKVEKVKLSSKTGIDLTIEKVGGESIKTESGRIIWEMPIDGIFVAAGRAPNTAAFEGVEINDKGYIVVHDHTKTSVEGVFVAGDVHDTKYQQAITAAGFGCAAGLETERWLRKKE